jgi:predicted transcriptional regulator
MVIMETVSTRLPEEWAAALDEIATGEHTTRSQLIRDMLLGFARSYKEDPDAAIEQFLGDTPTRPEQIDISDLISKEADE